MKKALKAIGAWSLVLVLTFAALDVTCRAYAYVAKIKLRKIPSLFIEACPEGSVYVFDRELGYKNRANYSKKRVQITADGLRSSTPTPADKQKILLLGDSMVFGVGVPQDEIFSELLNRKNGEYYFVNTGVIGYSTKQELITARHQLPRLKPKFTFVFFTEANDFWWNNRNDGWQPQLRRDGDGNLFFGEASEQSPPPFYKKTALYRLLSHLVLHGKDLRYLAQRLDYLIRGRFSDVWVMTRQVFLAMDGLARSEGSRLVIVDIPSDFPTPHGVGKSLGGSARREEWLREFSKENNIEYLSLRELYPPDASETLFLKNDSHWSPKGHRFVADLLTSFLDRQRKVASPAPSK